MPLPASPLLEIAVQDVESGRVAREHGADRFELCQALGVGGLTPSRGLMEHVASLGVPFRPLIRPRAGGFRYTEDEVAVMVRDVQIALECGAAGVVVGALTDSGLDTTALAAMVRAAAGMPVIVHRCVDVLLGAWGADPDGVAGQLVDLGVAGVLTSGGASRAVEGTDVIAALARAGSGELEIIAGGAVQPEHVPSLAGAGAHAVHLSAGGPVVAGPAGPGGGEDEFTTTTATGVTAARTALDALR